MKKVFLKCNSPCFTHLLLFFYWKKKYSKVLNVDVQETSTGPSCGTSHGLNYRSFWGRLRDVGNTCVLKFNSETYQYYFDRLLKIL